jgi:hypothetical protein
MQAKESTRQMFEGKKYEKASVLSEDRRHEDRRHEYDTESPDYNLTHFGTTFPKLGGKNRSKPSSPTMESIDDHRSAL